MVETTTAGQSIGAEALPRSKRSRLRVWGFWSIALLLALAGFAVGRMTRGIHHLPALAATLPGDESEFNREIDERIKELFPVGTSDKNLIAYLSAQGFTPEWREKDYANVASFIWTGVLCTISVRVIWRADAEGVLTQVDGSYRSQCVI